MSDSRSVCRVIFALALAVICSGCLTNYYEEYYVDLVDAGTTSSVQDESPVRLMTATSEDDVQNLLEEGYVVIGRSSFSGPYTSMSLAVDAAGEHGADLVLLDIRFRENKQYTSVMYLPTYSTTHDHGYLSSMSFGPRGPSNSFGTYSGTSYTTTWNAVPVQCNVDIFNHDALFFKKEDVSRIYGIRWDVPTRLPSERPGDPITVRIAAVIHGTRAERDGLKRGQIVKSVNGIAINTRADMVPFLEGTEIVNVEVEDAK